MRRSMDATNLFELSHPIRQDATGVDLHCPECCEVVTVRASQWAQINVDGVFDISPITTYGVVCDSCQFVFAFRPRLAIQPWPDDDCMTVPCPNCGATVDAHIGVPKAFDDAQCPIDCEACLAQFQLFANGHTKLVSAPPKVTTARGHALIKAFENFVFDPNEDKES